MPLPLRYFTALSPSLVSGHFTTTLSAIWDSSSPSFTMPSKSVATTSRLTSPGTIEQISSTSGRNGRFSLAISDGLVVTPSTTPMATPSLISATFAVSRKIFIVPLPSKCLRPFDGHSCARSHPLEISRGAGDAPDHVDGARGTDLVALARRGRTEEDAERVTRRPVAQVSQLDHGPRLFFRFVDADREVDLVAPRLGLRLDRQRIPDRPRRLGVVQRRLGEHGPRGDLDRTLGHH